MHGGDDTLHAKPVGKARCTVLFRSLLCSVVPLSLACHEGFKPHKPVRFHLFHLLRMADLQPDPPGDELLNRLPDDVVNILLGKAPHALNELFQASRTSRDLVLRHCRRITYLPGSDQHALLSSAASRNQILALTLSASHLAGQEQDAWLAAVCNTSLASANAGRPWHAVSELRICADVSL